LLFKNYANLIENNLQNFLKSTKITGEKLVDACKFVSENQENPLYSLDYLLASIEYEDFYHLMIDHKVNIIIW
jgi:hypothetical protein